MSPWRALGNRLRALLQKARLDADMDEEMRTHIEMRAQRNLDAGMDPEEARYAARRQFGPIESIQDACRGERGVGWIEDFLHDVRHGARRLGKDRGFTAVSVLTLALGIGAVVAIFAAADDLLFRPLPYRAPDRLFRLWERDPTRPETARSEVSADDFMAWKAGGSSFEGMAAYYEGRAVLHDGERADELHVQGVTPGFFPMLGIGAFHGRTFAPDDGPAPGTSAPVIISFRLWRSWFGGDPDAVGRAVRLDSATATIIGVTPPGFRFGDRDVDLWLPLHLRPSKSRDLNAVGRLKRGVGRAEAEAQLSLMVQPWMATVEPLRDSFTRSVKGSLLVLLGAVGLLLGAACANAASLLLARNRARRSEMAMRLALGASRGRLVRQLLTESLLLAMCAGALGVALGRYALYALVALAPRALTRSADVAIDGRVVLFAVAVSAATALLFGAVPAAVSARADVAPELARNSRGGGPRAGSLRAWLIAGEVAVSLILLTGGSLLFRSLVKLQEVDSGLMPRHLLAFHFRVPSPDKVNLFDLSRERIAVLPGVRAASATSFLPFDGPPAAARVEIEGRPAPAPGEEPVAAVRTVMPRYFGTIGIPIRQGRDFTAADNGADAPMRFVVNEAFVRKYLPGQEPLGRRIRTSMARTNPLGEIIGVVGDVKEGSMRQEPVPTVYYVYAHMSYGQMTLVVRTEGDPMAILALVRRVVHDLDPGLPVADARAMDAILGETYARERFSALLMAGFSILSLLVAAVGVYGVLACSVQERTREIGVRVAVGADGRRIVELVLGDTLRLVLPGLLAGLGGALSLSRLLSSLLFKTGAWDPASFAIAAGTLLVVALVAAASPAGRAARLDPTAALRLE